MIPLRLIVPDIDPAIDSSGFPKPEDIDAWIEVLTLGNPEKAAEQLIVLLRHYNKVELDASERRVLMNSLVLPANDAAKALQSKYRDSALPLSERNQDRYYLIDQLYAEIAVGYKCIVIAMHNEAMNVKNGEMFISVVDKAIHFLGKQLLAAYSVYMTEPMGIWGDLNQLYQCSEFFSRHAIVNETEKLQHLTVIAKRSYRRIVLLSVANPYHLMQGEANIIFNYLNKWSVNTSITPLQGYVAGIGDLVLDLGNDSAPQFIYNEEFEEPAIARTLNMQNLMDKFNSTIEKLAKRHHALSESNTTFTERMRRDMLIRLQSVWIERLRRKSARTVVEKKVRLAEGLSACHYFIDAEQEFFPERDEIRQHCPEGIKEGFTLVPDEYEPWRQEKEEDQVFSNLENARISNFDDDAMDIWHKIYANKSAGNKARMSALNHFETYYWHLVNHSIDGIGLKRYRLSNARVHVGSLVTFHDEADKDLYHVGVIRWIKQNNQEDFDMGVKVIVGKPQAIAARGIGGTGNNSEYFRSIIIETEYKDQTRKSIILPTSIFDVGSSVVINTRDGLEYVTLTEMISTTTTIAQYAYKVMDLPKEELERIAELKKLS